MTTELGKESSIKMNTEWVFFPKMPIDLQSIHILLRILEASINLNEILTQRAYEGSERRDFLQIMKAINQSITRMIK